MAEKVDYFATLRRKYPLATSDDSYDQTAKILAGVQSSRAGLKALGQEEEPKNRGILSTLFDEQKGILTAPMRFGSALLLDLAGLEDTETGKELRGKNPLQSAIASARGDFAITGGDIFKVNDGDSFGERLTKYAGALAFDITTDPISYFGPVGILSKKAGAVIAVRQGGDLLNAATKLIIDNGGQADTLVDNLFRRTRLFQAADAQRRFAKVDSVIDPQSPMGQLGMSLDGVVDEAVKANTAGLEFGRIIGESFLTGGRAKTRKQLSEVLGSDDLADKVFKQLPDEIRGGMFLKNPITGRPLARVAGGAGGGGAVAETAARLRFGASSVGGTGWVSKYFSGQTGPTWLDVKKGLLRDTGLGDVGRTTLLDYTSYKDAFRAQKLLLSQLGVQAQAALSSVAAVRRVFEGQGSEKGFDDAFRTYFFSPTLAVGDNADDAVKEGYSAAMHLRSTMRDAYDNLTSIGFEMGDLGPNSSPLMFTEEAAREFQERELRQVGAAGDPSKYRITEKRDAFVQIIDDPELRAIAGFDAPGIDNAVMLNAVSVNKQLEAAGKKAIYETDPLKIAVRYLKFANSSMASHRFNQVALSTGTILRFPAESAEVLKDMELIGFLSAAPRATAAARAKAKKLEDSTTARLKAMTSGPQLKAVQADIRQQQARTLAAYRSGQTGVSSARRALVEANQEVATAAEAYQQMLAGAQLRQYGQTGVEQAEEAVYRQMRNAQSRLSKARKAAEEGEQLFEEVANTPAGPSAAGQLRQRLEKVESEFVSVEDARSMLNEARQYREQAVSRISQRQADALNAYESALGRQLRAAEELSASRQARDTARDSWYASRRNTTLERAASVDTVVEAYVRARTNFMKVRSRIGRVTVKSMTPEQALEFNAAKETFKLSKKIMMDVLGHYNRAKTVNAGTIYAKAVVEAANVLSMDQFNAARVISNAEAMDIIVNSLEGASRDTLLNAVGDIFTSYKGIREYLSAEELKALGTTEAKALSLTADEAVKVRPAVPAAARELMDEPNPGASRGFRQIGSGEGGTDMILPRNLADSYAPDGVASLLEQMYTAQGSPSAWKKYVDTIIDPLSLSWRSAVTVGRGPAYVLNNLVGGLANNFYARISARSHRISGAMLAQVNSTTKKMGKEFPELSYDQRVLKVRDELESKLGSTMVGDRTVLELFYDFLDRGGHFSTHLASQQEELRQMGLRSTADFSRTSNQKTFVKEAGETNAQAAARSVANFVLNNRYQTMMGNASQNSEVFLRFAAFIDGYKRFKNVDSAMDLTMALHFDYQDLSDAEVWIKRIGAPFYTWARHNIPLQFRALFLAPDQMGKLMKANQNAKEAFGADSDAAWLNDFLPDYMNTQGGFVSAFKFGGNHLGLFGKVPLYDLEKMFQVEYIGGLPIIMPRRTELVNIASPLIKSPIEVLTGRNFEYGRAYDSTGNMLQDQFSNWVPQVGIITKGLSAAGLPVQEDRRASNFWQLLGGSPLGATTYTERTLRGAAISKSRDLSSQMKKAAEEAGVDIDWLRSKIRSGATPEQISRMILLGYGNKDRLALLESLSGGDKKESARNYDAVLQGLREGRTVTGY
jgi:hypothetical protein